MGFSLRMLRRCCSSHSADSQGHRRKSSIDAMLAKQVSVPQLTTKIKGLMKGFRSISQIFESNAKEQEPEMQIGYPTDVKHVSHGGSIDPSLDGPSWMNEFKIPGQSVPPPVFTTGKTNGLTPTKEQGSISMASVSEDSFICDSQERLKLSRHQQDMDQPIDEQSDAPKASKRKNSKVSTNATGEASDASKPSRNQQAVDRPINEQSDAPKATKRKNSKAYPTTSTGEASDASKQSKQQNQKASSGSDSSTKDSSNRQRRKKTVRSSDSESIPSRTTSRAVAVAAAAAANSDCMDNVKKTKEESPALKTEEKLKIEISL